MTVLNLSVSLCQSTIEDLWKKNQGGRWTWDLISQSVPMQNTRLRKHEAMKLAALTFATSRVNNQTRIRAKDCWVQPERSTLWEAQAK